MNLAEHQCRALLAAARVARLATVDADAAPHLVPVTFVADGDAVFTAVDGKPKRSRSLRRLETIRGNPAVSLLVDVYDEDWRRLWWVRADGRALVRETAAECAGPIALLRAKYPQYAEVAIPGPVIEIAVERWSGWAYEAAAIG